MFFDFYLKMFLKYFLLIGTSSHLLGKWARETAAAAEAAESRRKRRRRARFLIELVHNILKTSFVLMLSAISRLLLTKIHNRSVNAQNQQPKWAVSHLAPSTKK